MLSKLFSKGFYTKTAAAIVITGSLVTGAHAAELLPRIPALKNTPLTSVNSNINYQRIVVKFKEGTGVQADFSGLYTPASAPGLIDMTGFDLADLTEQVNQINQAVSVMGLNFSELFSTNKQVLEQLKANGEARLGKQLADLTLYFELPVYGLSNSQIENIVNMLNGFNAVEVAYAKPESAVAAITPDFQDADPADPNKKFQGYLNSAEETGIDAKYAWNVSGGKGEGVKVVDIEGAWTVTHEDFPPMFYSNGTMSTSDLWIDHGTAVMGVMGAVENDFGVTGIAPDAQYGYASIGSQSSSVAIANAAAAVGEGGIVLIELHRNGPTYQEECSCNTSQCNYIAIEYWQDDFDAIQTATANGVIVVEAAGNGSANLDSPIYEGKFNPAVRDSGAILVGGSYSAARGPKCWSNFGERVDVHGWGENVVTLGYGNLYSDPNDPENFDYQYTYTFNGTSSASPVVTGAAAALQGVSLASNGTPLTPQEMRTLLKTTGTPQTDELDRPIGPLPNLRAAINSLIGEPLCNDYTSTNSEHESAGRAYSETEMVGQTCWGSFCYGGTQQTTWYVQGSDEELGTSASTINTIYMISANEYALGECPTPDTTAPVITLNGESTMQVYQGAEFTDPGATATDDRDGDLSGSITVTGSVNTAIMGAYTLTYSVADAAGNQASVSRTVNVVAAPACMEYTSTLTSHESAGRAYSETEMVGQTCWGSFCYGGTQQTTWYATGSAQELGSSGSASVTLKEQPVGYFEQGTCPADPQPPVITSTQVSIYADDMTITGTATDPDGDITASVIYFQGGGVECEGTTNFTCVLNDLPPGDYEVAVKVVDSGMRDSELVQINFVIEEPAVPVVTLDTLEIIGNNLVATGTATDINNDIIALGIALPGPYGADCVPDGAAFYCSIDISGYAPGTYSGRVTAIDSRSEWGNAEFEFTVEEVIQHAPVISNVVYAVDGLSLTVTADVTDADGDLQDVLVVVTSEVGGFDCENTSGDTYTCVAAQVSPRTYTMLIKAIDAAGNVTQSDEFTVVVEEPVTHAPEIDSVNYSVNGSTLVVTGTASDEDGDLTSVILSGNGLPGPLTCSGAASFTCTVEGLVAGDYSLQVVAYDAEDNSSAPYTGIDFTVEEQSQSCFTDSNSNHGAAGRATLKYNILYYANGSNAYLGMAGDTTTLQETSAGYWEKVTSCP